MCAIEAWEHGAWKHERRAGSIGARSKEQEASSMETREHESMGNGSTRAGSMEQGHGASSIEHGSTRA
ncbi:hypothetical protein D3C75_1250300 [compost metagenome]